MIKYSILFIAFSLSGFQPGTKQKGDIILKDGALSFTPKEFYISGVIDQRADRTAIALLLSATGTSDKHPKAAAIDLHGGTFVAVKQFIDHNFQNNKLLRPLIIRIKKFKIVESSLSAKRYEGKVSLDISFDLQMPNDDPVPLGEYSGSANYNRPAGPPQDIEPTLRHLLENGLEYINTWMNEQANTNIKLAKGVKVIITDFAEKREGDSIYYSVNRPLTWNDFQSKTGNKKYDAEVYPTFGYEERNEIINGIVNISMQIKVYLPKSASWVKDGKQNSYSLNHEQRHFDIAKLVAEHFKRKIKQEGLLVTNFDGQINVDYLEAYRELHTLQKQYDDETRHGVDELAQQLWNTRIDKELKELGVKKG
jgi:hypothetical protein